jgi:hypothetical protein
MAMANPGYGQAEMVEQPRHDSSSAVGGLEVAHAPVSSPFAGGDGRPAELTAPHASEVPAAELGGNRIYEIDSRR